jgi:N-acetylglucosaminyldiphosphoundecaprenol N-acetyl-beta-D-mannosaminyltransferase
MDRSRLLYGLEVDALTMPEVLQRCEETLRTRKRMLIGVINAAKVVNLKRDRVLRESLLECDVLLADGQSIVWASALLRQPLPQRVAGADLFVRLLEIADRDHASVYLLGATASTLAKLSANIAVKYPGLILAGSHDGYFDQTAAEGIAQEIRDSGADMLFLGMTSPKKEVFLGEWGPTLTVPILHGVGGAFDIQAGITKRAPLRWQGLGLEWLYRLLQEPRRMWKRYLRTNSIFLAMTARELVRPTPNYRQT